MDKKIGLFLGTFNPIHIGHLFIANKSLDQTDIDEVWFVVSPESPDKVNFDLIDIDSRIKMVEISIKDYDNIYICDIEKTLPKPSYTINTLKALSEIMPDFEFSIIMGSDNFKNINNWTNFKDVIENYRFIVFGRPGYDITDSNICKVSIPKMEISSTYIREEIKNFRSVKYLVPDDVISYIKDNRMYINENENYKK